MLEHYDLALSVSSYGVWDWDLKTGKCFYSQTYRDLIGYDEEEFPNTIESWNKVIKPSDQALVKAIFENHEKNLDPYEIEYRLITKYNGTRWFKVYASSIRDDKGNILRMVGTLRDIEDEVQTQNILRKELSRNDYIFKRNPALIVSFDPYGNILKVNPKMCEVSGYSEHELVGENWWKIFFPHEAGQRYQELVETFRRRGELTDYHMDMRTKNGALKTISWTSLNNYNENVEVDEIIGYGIDITETIRSQEALIEAKNQAEEANRAKSCFLASMSHEIRTPMNGVLGTAELLCDTELTKKQKNYIDTILASGQNLLTILNEILDFSKIEAGKLAIHKAPINLHTLIEERINLLTSVAQEKSIALNFHTDDELPEYVLGDSLRLTQVITNLISNALKFTDSGGQVDVRIFLDTEEGEEQLKITVADTGIGIKPDDIKDIFQSFKQVPTQEFYKSSGTGLGLTISKHLTNLMGGKIGVESKYGVGSTFWIKLPLEYPDPKEIEKVKTRTISSYTKQNQEQTYNLHALIVEDIPTNQFIIGDMLENLGCTIDIAENGQIALTKIMENNGAGQYDVIFMDCMMPIMDGYTATQEIRKQPSYKNIPVIALTANALKEDRQKCLDAGMDDVIHKPMRKHDFMAVFEKWLGHESSHDKKSQDDFDQSSILDDSTIVAINAAIEAFGARASTFVELTVADADKFIEDIKAAYSDKNLKEIHLCAHSLKSIFKQINADDLGQTALRIEELSQESYDDDTLDKLINTLLQKYDTLRDYLKQKL